MRRCVAPLALFAALAGAAGAAPPGQFQALRVAATCKAAGRSGAPHAGPARAAQSASGATNRRTARTETYFFVKTDFGIMQCTPLRTSTTCETRQSPTMETSA